MNKDELDELKYKTCMEHDECIDCPYFDGSDEVNDCHDVIAEYIRRGRLIKNEKNENKS